MHILAMRERPRRRCVRGMLEFFGEKILDLNLEDWMT